MILQRNRESIFIQFFSKSWKYWRINPVFYVFSSYNNYSLITYSGLTHHEPRNPVSTSISGSLSQGFFGAPFVSLRKSCYFFSKITELQIRQKSDSLVNPLQERVGCCRSGFSIITELSNPKLAGTSLMPNSGSDRTFRSYVHLLGDKNVGRSPPV